MFRPKLSIWQMKIFLENYNWKIRCAVSVLLCLILILMKLCSLIWPILLKKREKLERLEKAVDDVRRRFEAM